MQTEWLKVMLEEVARKRDETARGREEMARRASEREATSKTTAGRPARARPGRSGRG